MEASLVEQPQLQGPPSAEQSLTEQAPKTEPSILLQQRDCGRPIEPQEHLKEPSLEKNVMDHPPQDHHSKHSPIEHHQKEPSIEKNPQSEQLHNKPSEGSSVSNASAEHDHSKTSPSKEHPKEASSEKILMETPLEHHHTQPSPSQEHLNETCIEKNVVETLPEQHHTKSAIVQEHHNETNPMDTPSEHHHFKSLPTHEHHREPLLENKMDSFTQQQHAKPSLTHDHHTEGSMENNSAEHHQVESLSETRKSNSSTEILQADSSKKADQKDHTVERFSVGLSTEGQPVKSFTPQQESVLPAVLSQYPEQHRKVVQETTYTVVDLSSRQQQINPMIEQHQVNVPNEHKQLTQPSEHESLDLSTEQSLSVSSQHSTDVPTGHHLKPSLEQNQVEPPKEQPYSEPTVKEHLVKPVIEHTGSSSLSQQEANEGPFGVSSTENPHLETTTPAEAHGNFTEELTTKQPQIFNLRSQKPTRAEIDTAAPFESVKAAVSLFGERMDWKSQLRNPQMQAGSSTERRTLPEPELHKAQEDLVYYKDKLALTQASTAGVLLELKKVKKLIQNPASKQEGTDILSHKSMEAADASKSTASMDKPANLELQSILREVESVKEELISATVSKEAAVKGLQDALSSLNTVLKRVEELGGEKASLDEAVADAHIALADAEEQVALLRSGHKVDSINSVPSDYMEKKSAEIKGLESKLEETTAMIIKLKQELELLVSKQAESMTVAAATETQQKMAKVQLELDQAKSEELSIVGKLAKILEESDEFKTKLEKATQERDTLSSTIQSLKADVERARMELDSMHENEQIACATLASLQDELHKVKEALQLARVGEARALEAKDTLPASIKQAASEADEAKAAAEASKEEARKARQEIEQAKAATSTALSRQQAALKELEAAKASEAMASADLKAMKESETQGADMESELEGIMGVTISLEEYSALKQAAVEAEGLANKKVAEAIALVEEAKASQSRAQSKVDDASKEAEKRRDELQRTQKQADDAQEAKLTAEANLRKWRAEHDQRRKSGGAPLDLKAGSTQSSPRTLSSDEKVVQPVSQEKQGMVPPFVQGKKVAGRDSLAQIMSLQAPTPERRPGEDSMKDKEKVKKKNFIRRIASIVSLKRKP